MQLSKDLSERFPDDRGYSGHNLRNMKKFASEYPAFPIWQVPLAKLEQLPIRKGFVQVSLAQISDNPPLTVICKSLPQLPLFDK